MNESETRAELIDPKLKASGWGVVEGSRILREYHITAGKIQTGDYAAKLHLDYTYSSNGKEIYQINMRTGREGLIASFPKPDELWNNVFTVQDEWRDKFNSVPFEDIGGTKTARYYQEIAVNNAMAAIAQNKPRILLTLATGTGKTFISFQIAWKLFQTRWNLRRDGARRPRILFLADRNILADQAYNSFGAFQEDALVRISPREISKTETVPVNGSVFFTIFQTFMSGPDNTPYFGQYPKDYFDFIIIDECHRGGANDEGTWRGIMEYFSPAVQLGMTATPKRKDNVDTYRYFGEPVYVYSLKEGINDGFLTPFKVKRISTTLDDYTYTSDDTVVEGEIEQGKRYVETDFNRIIEIKEREAKRVKVFLSEINQSEKSIVFCATQDHAMAVRDLVNQLKDSPEPNYCARVTANDGALGEQYLRAFQDNEKSIPTILTTSQKLSTGVDARNIRNIILMRPVNSMIEFKQIIGRGTRLFDGKEYFTIYDFVDAYHHFSDPDWDGEPIDETTDKPKREKQPTEIISEPPTTPYEPREKIKVKLRDGKEREIQHMIQTSFWSPDGQPISAEEFLHKMFGSLPDFFKSEEELRRIWSNPVTRKALLVKLADAGYGKDVLANIQKLVNAEKSDLFDVLEYISFAVKPITRELRVAQAQSRIFRELDDKQKDFLGFVLAKYIETGVEELDHEKLPELLELKYYSMADATEELGGVDKIKNAFIGFQKHLYERRVG
ncbi:MAG: DEAD/DEAH box helicase family protein [Planctomycetes bacterium]|nr:DEAD/DEAH box helicase family protein [Planctomycetota bacterium]